MSQEAEYYHSESVRKAIEKDPRLLSMLVNGEIFAVDPEELTALLSWVREQPEVV